MILPLSPSYKWMYEGEKFGNEGTDFLRYKFLHDRIQQAVYSTMTAVEKEQNHLKIGRILLSYFTSQNQSGG